MGWLNRVLSIAAAPFSPAPAAQSLNDPRLLEAIRGWQGGGAGDALRNAAVYRCVMLISNAIAQLPLQLLRTDGVGGIAKADQNPLYDVLSLQPNQRQTAFVFRRQMQQWLLLHGNAFARIVRNRDRVIGLLPLDPRTVTIVEQIDGTVFYRVNRAGGTMTLTQTDVLHIMGPSHDGVRGMHLMQHADDVLTLSRAAASAARRTFENGVMANNALSTDKELSDAALERLKSDMDSKFAGPDNAGRTMVLEGGLKPVAWASSMKDAQNVELRSQQVEEVARIFGVPRPFLMVDDTSWGSGIEQLGIFFVQYGLAPWFVAWEQAIQVSLLTSAERRTHYVKFNERALLRGSMKDQAEFFAKALGSGGSPAWMTQDEVRGFSELAPRGGLAGELSPGSSRVVGVQI
jgi:HK97 family phage portal protein